MQKAFKKVFLGVGCEMLMLLDILPARPRQPAPDEKRLLLSYAASTVKNTLNAYLIKTAFLQIPASPYSIVAATFVWRHKLNFTNYTKSFRRRI